MATETKPKFDWDTLLFKLQTTLTSRKFAALLAALGTTWTAYGNHQIDATLAVGGTLLSLAAYSYAVAHEDAAKP